jgi:hypothetical protein
MSKLKISTLLMHRSFQDTGRLVFWTSHARIAVQGTERRKTIFLEIYGQEVRCKLEQSEISKIFGTESKRAATCIVRLYCRFETLRDGAGFRVGGAEFTGRQAE